MREAEHDPQTVYPRNLYSAFVTTLDAHIRKLVEKVDELGPGKDTIFIFQSDHGHSVEVHAHEGGGSKGPYRGHKFTMFAGGLRVPAIISWGKLPRNEVRSRMAHGCDWLPTIAERCGVEFINEDIDGKSLLGVIRSSLAPSPHDVLHW